MLDWLQREGQRVMWAVAVGALVGGLNAHAHHVGSIGFGLWLLLGGCVGWFLINPAAVVRNIAAAWRLAMTNVPKAKITSVIDGSAVRRFIKEFCFVMIESLRCALLEFVSVISLWLASSSWILLACFFLGAKSSVYMYVLRMMVGVGLALATTMSLVVLVHVSYHQDMLPAAKRINPLAVLCSVQAGSMDCLQGHSAAVLERSSDHGRFDLLGGTMSLDCSGYGFLLGGDRCSGSSHRQSDSGSCRRCSHGTSNL